MEKFIKIVNNIIIILQKNILLKVFINNLKQIKKCIVLIVTKN